MKIIQCISSLDKSCGGPSRSLPSLCIGLKRIQVYSEILSYSSLNPNQDKLLENEIKITFIQREKNIWKKSFCKDFHVNEKISSGTIVHLHSLWEMALHNIASFCRKEKIPYVWSPRGTLEPWALSQKKLKKKVALFFFQRNDLLKATCIHATAESEAQNIRRLGFDNPIAIIPNGIDITNYPLKNHVTTRTKKTLLFLSRIHPKKGLEMLFEVWQHLPKGLIQDWKIVIVGEGCKEYSLDSLNNLILSEYKNLDIHVVGPKYGHEKIECYHQADLFILPTFSENFGMVVAEAMACGVPVITTTGTPWKVLKEQNVGWWVEPTRNGLTEALENALALSDNSLIIKGLNSRRIIEEKYSASVVSLQYKELYEWILDDSKKSPEFMYKNNSSNN